MLVYVKTLTGQEVPIDCEPTDSSEDFKQKIQDKIGVPVDRQRLVFAGKCFCADMTVQSIGIKDQSIVHLILRLTEIPS